MIMNRRLFIKSIIGSFSFLVIQPSSVKAEVQKRIIIHRMTINCVGMGLTPVQCSDQILTKLGHGPTFKLKADNENDIVHGAIMVAHLLPPEQHIIRVEIYQQDGPPRNGRKSFLKRHNSPPTDDEIRALLNKP